MSNDNVVDLDKCRWEILNPARKRVMVRRVMATRWRRYRRGV
jgi:hypothetical protein